MCSGARCSGARHPTEAPNRGSTLPVLQATAGGGSASCRPRRERRSRLARCRAAGDDDDLGLLDLDSLDSAEEAIDAGRQLCDRGAHEQAIGYFEKARLTTAVRTSARPGANVLQPCRRSS